ncbi:MAG: S8 family serine peptidase [Acidimicrobiales bacterium]
MAGTAQRSGLRAAACTLTAALALLITAVPANAADRDGPPDGPRGRNQRVSPPDEATTLPGYDPQAPTASSSGKGAVIPNQYIVVFRPGTPGVADLAQRITNQNGGQVTYTYEHALQGFAAVLPDHALEGIRRNPNVTSIEPDTVAVADDVQSPATWGLDRTDQRYLPLDNSFDDRTQGTGAHVYVIDTGLRKTHTEFTGRVGNGYDAVTLGGAATDCNGHGTHVAGTAAGSVYGVADKATVHPVRVLGCNGSGSNSGVIAGIDWVRANAVKPAVANMSLGGGASSALDTAAQNLIASGVSLAVAAGNENTNACNSSPARVSTAITTGATTSTDARASYSNWGTCLDLFAPGSSITSAWSTGDTVTNTISGTSMATPHVTGVAALYLSANPTATAQQVRDAIVTNATTGRVVSPGTGSPNLLLYSGFVGSSTPPPPPPPPPPPSGNALVNPGFESGTTGWTQSSSGGYQLITTTRPRTGSYGVYLGGYNSAVESIRQTVTVPTNGTLRYYWYMTSSESGATVYDRLYVRVYRASDGVLLSSSQRVTNASARNAWYQDSVSLASYAGQSVWVSFYATTDSSLSTSFFIDDTSLS